MPATFPRPGRGFAHGSDSANQTGPRAIVTGWTWRRVRWVAFIVATCTTLPTTALYLWRSEYQHNFGTIVPDRLYRSAQLGRGAIAPILQRHHIKTVLNLRGTNVRQRWYRDERDAVLAAGRDAGRPRDGELRPDVPVAVAHPRARARYERLPIALHRQHGSERSGWASAVATLLRPGATLADGAQFSVGYLYFGIGDGKIMAEHLDQYEHWLKTQGANHSPERFREWVDHGFRPGHPSREDWPYDPSPLIAITRPRPPAHVTTAGKRDVQELRR